MIKYNLLILKGFVLRYFHMQATHIDNPNDFFTLFHTDISRVIEMIKSGDEMRARHFFNTELIQKYGEKVVHPGPLSVAFELWQTLNTYFNNEGARILGEVTTTKEFLLSVYEDYEHDLKEQKTPSHDGV